MKKIYLVSFLAVALFCAMAVNAIAVPINGAISFSGTSGNDNEDLTLATAFLTFSEVVVSSTGGTGDYSSVPADQPVTLTPFTFRPALSPAPLIPLWAFEFAGISYSFDATSLQINYASHDTISIQGIGMAYITGFDATPADWYFSANSAGGTASFSLSSEAVSPVSEPATMLLLGTGLLGLAGAARKKFKK